MAVPSVSAAATIYVDGSHLSCSDAGPGTPAVPYCTIGAAIAAEAAPATTFLVQPGIYREQITLPLSGGPGAPIVIRADGPVTVDCADDFTNPALWTQASGNVWLAASVSWTPQQVFVDGARLVASTASPSSLPSGTFRHVVGTGLYANVGGGNPGLRSTHVGHRLYGFRGSGRSNITIDGFTILRAEDRGIYFSSGSNFVTLLNNTVHSAYRPGIQVTNSTDALIAANVSSGNLDHGIALTNCSASVIEANATYGNQKLTGVASGIYLSNAPDVVIQRNRIYDNTGSGLYMQDGSNNNRCVQNASWGNGRRGYDLWASTGTVHIGDVAWGNTQSGFAVRETATGTQLYNCIGVDNGLASGEYDLEVASTATSGFVSSDNIWWNSTSQSPIQFNSTAYATLSAFQSATGQGSRSIQADPRFVSPATGNFYLQAGSPAIDSGNSSVTGWPATDAEGQSRSDDPATPNTGVGPIPYADRGAHEYAAPVSMPPNAALSVIPGSGAAPLFVIADASLSTPGDAAIASYRFDFGDGTVVGPQAQSSATHTYGAGTWLARVTVTDLDGDTAEATQNVFVSPGGTSPPNGVIDTPVKNLVVAPGQAVFFTGTGSDPDGDLPLTFLWDMGGGAPDATVEDPEIVTFDTPGVYTITLHVTDSSAASDPTPDTRIITVTPPPEQLSADEVHWTVTGQTSVTFDWRGSVNTIQFGLTPAYGQSVTATAPSPYPWSSAGPFWEAKLTGLQEDTVYHYSIGGSPDQTFHTAPPRGSSDFTVAMLADVGTADYYPRVGQVAAQIAAQAPDMVLIPGDLTYADDHGREHVDLHFNDMMVWAREAPYMPAWGNHEWGSSEDDLRNYKGRFDLPNERTSPGASTPGGEDWYWYDYGNVRFIAYPEPWSGAFDDWGVQIEALMDSAQTDPAIDYIVTFGHRPAYSSGHHSGDTKLQDILGSLGATHSKFVLNLNGHSHNYERTYPQSGVTHVTVGIGGSTLEARSGSCLWEGGCPPPAYTAFRAFHHGFLKLTFTATGILGEAICGPPGDGSNPNDVLCEMGSVFDSFTIGNPDRAPVVNAPANAAAVESGLVQVEVGASDPDGETITLLTADLSNLPAGHGAAFTPSFGNTSGTLSWTPTFADAGNYDVTFTASNGLSGFATTTIGVANVDRAPEVTAPATAAVAEGETLSVAVTAADPDGDPISGLTADLSALPAGHGASFVAGPDNTSGTLTWTPGFADAGGFAVSFIASNAVSDTAATTITVSNTDRAPLVSAPATAAAAEAETLTIAVSVSDPDGEPIASLTADLSALPAGHGASFASSPDHTSGTLTWVPSFAASGSYAVSFIAANALQDTAATSVTIANVDRAPLLSAPASVAGAETTPLTIEVSATDPDGDAIFALTADLSEFPSGHGATFTPAADKRSGTLYWTPSFEHAGSYVIHFVAVNSLIAQTQTSIEISNTDRAPLVVAPASASVEEGAPLTITVTASDPDGDAITSLTADLSELPSGHGATFTPGPGNQSGTLSWTPDFGYAGTFAVGFVGVNALSDTAATTITVVNVNREPIVSAPAFATAAEAETLSIVVSVVEPDGDPIESLTADLSALPAGHGASFVTSPDRTSGTLTWVPSFNAAGSHLVTFVAANALLGAAATKIEISNVDRAPVLSAPASVPGAEGASISIAVSAADPDGEAIASLTADLSALPSGHGAVFTPAADNRSGTLQWTPSFEHAGNYAVSFVAANALSDTGATTITVSNVDREPIVSAPAFATAAEAETLSIAVSVADPDGEPIESLTADLSALPAGHGATFVTSPDHTSGTLTWVPNFDAAGSHLATFTAANALLGAAAAKIQISNVDRAPLLSAPVSVPAAEGAPISIEVSATDPDGDAIVSLTADLSGLPSGHGAVFTPAADNRSGTLQWTPSFEHAGNYAVSFVAANALSDTGATTITVSNVDREPIVWAPAFATAAEAEALSIEVNVADPDGDPIESLTADLSALPAGHGASFVTSPDRTSGTLTWVPNATAAGSHAVSFVAANALQGNATTSIHISNVDLAPVLSAPASVAGAEGVPITIEVSATDPDGDAIVSLTADLSGLPFGHGAIFTPAGDMRSGTLQWTPSFEHAGDYAVDFAASNALTAQAPTSIAVSNTDRAPLVVAPASVFVQEGALLTVEVTASDPDGDALTSLTADLSQLPAGHSATFTPGPGNLSGTLNWTPRLVDSGLYAVTFTASNALGGDATTSITVRDQDRAPVVTASTIFTGAEAQSMSFSVTASDPDGDAIASLAADLSGLPAGNDASFTPAPGNLSGTLSWTPTHADSGLYSVTFTASNALQHVAQTTLHVTNVDRAPILTAPPLVAAAENAPLSFTVSAGDPDGDPISILLADYEELPPGNAGFVADSSNSTGTFTWTPKPGDGVSQPFTVSFTAQNAEIATAGTVVQVDRAPVVTVLETVTAFAGSLVTVVVSAADPNGDPIASLTADLTNLPGAHDGVFVADSSNTSGTLTWTPSFADTGNFSIAFRASNATWGESSTSIEVMSRNQPPQAAASLSSQLGVAPFALHVDASASLDPGGTIVSYQFDFGDGTVVGPQARPLATHIYTDPGVRALVVWVTDGFGVTDSIGIPVTVYENLCWNSSFEENTAGWGTYLGSLFERVPGGYVGGFMLRITGPDNLNEFGVNDSPDWVSGASVAGQHYHYTAMVRSVTGGGTSRMRVREYNGGSQQGVTTYSPVIQLTPEWQAIVVDYVAVMNGSSLNLQILDDPLIQGEVFELDYVTISLVADVVTAVSDDPVQTSHVSAFVRPNPMHGSAAVAFTLPRSGPVTLQLFDVNGRSVRRILDRLELNAGTHEAPIDRHGDVPLPAGVYFYRLVAPGGSAFGRFVVLD